MCKLTSCDQYILYNKKFGIGHVKTRYNTSSIYTKKPKDVLRNLPAALHFSFILPVVVICSLDMQGCNACVKLDYLHLATDKRVIEESMFTVK
jgi:hypothetical protein